MKTFKRTISVMLAAALILSTSFISDFSGVLPKAEAAVTATEPSYGDLYFVVPETIYLSPRANAYTADTQSSFQWYVNDVLNGTEVTLEKGESGTGNLYFYYRTATDVRISYKWQSSPGVEFSGGGSISYGDGVMRTPSSTGYLLQLDNGRGAAAIISGMSPELTASTSGIWICWIATYTDSADGQQKQAYAYTYVYKPYVAPIAVGVRSVNTRGRNFYGAYWSWISGVHGVITDANGNPVVRSGASWPNTSGKGFIPFSSSADGYECEFLNLTLPSYFSFPNGNENPGDWISSSRTGVPDATAYRINSTTSSHNSGDDYMLTYGYSSTGRLTVDSSRYQNLNEVPNLSVGLMVTDDEKSDHGAAYFLSNFYGHTSTFDSDLANYWKTSDSSHISEYWDALWGNDQIAKAGSRSNMNAPEGEGVKFNERWRRDISGASSGVFYVGSGYVNQQNGDYNYDVAELRCNVELFDKSALRDAYFYAMKTFSVNNIKLFTSANMAGENTDSWRNFIELYRAVAKWLCKVDSGAYTRTNGYGTATELANALKLKADEIKPLSNNDRVSYKATQSNVKVYDDNGVWKLARNGNTTVTSDYYHKGARVEFSSEIPAGYTFAGHVNDYRETQTTPGSATVKKATDVTPGECVVPHASKSMNCSYYYVRNEYTITYELNGGELPAGASNPTSFNIESSTITLQNPVKAGYAFGGWIGTGLYSLTPTVTIPAGSTGNRSYEAIWSAHTYSVHYDGNGATGGNMADSIHTFGEPKQLSQSAFTRFYYITYHLNNADDEVWEDEESAGFEFAGWNTRPDGSGTGYVNSQMVYDLTTENTYTLYAQWNPIQDVLPTPDWSNDWNVYTGFAFVGWYTDPSCEDWSFFGAGGAAVVIESNIELYAKWEQHVYTIHYNGNGATGGATPNSIHHAGVSEPLSTNGFRREYTVTFDPKGGTVSPASTQVRYTFWHWTTDAAGNGTVFQPDATVIDLTSENTLELYAQWFADVTSVTPPTPLREGFDFDCWCQDSDCTVPLGDSFVPEDNVTIYAKWTPKEYTITLEIQGGTQLEIHYTIQSNDTLPNTSRTGYTFGGWKPTTSEGNWDMERTYAVGTNVNGKYGNVTLIAQWTPIEYMITYDANGGLRYPDATTNQKPFNIESTDVIGEPTRYGYRFDNWTVLETSGNWDAYGATYGANTSLNGKYGNVSLQAQWTKLEYTITFDTAGGEPIAEKTYAVDAPSTETLPRATKNGFTFIGWKPATSSGSWDADLTYLAGTTSLTGKYGDVTLVAQWTLENYILTFDEKGGSEVLNILYNSESIETLLPSVRTAYTFGGWKPKATVGSWDSATVYPAGTSLTGKYGAATLVAVWNPIMYTITFNTDGAGNYPLADDANCVLYYTTEGTSPQSEQISGWNGTLKNPEKAGYIFDCWVVTASDPDGNWGEVGTTYKEGAMLMHKYGNVSMTAQWKSEGFQITYDLTGGTYENGATNPTSYTTNSLDFTLIQPVKTGYNFAGWTGTDLTEPTIDVMIPHGSMGERSYTATWSAIDYTINYNLDGGTLASGQSNPTSYTIETPSFYLNVPTRDGYEFAGWTGTDLTEARVSVQIAKGSYGYRSYMATWTPKVNTITYNGMQGAELTEPNPTQYTILTPTFTLHNPTKDGYTFNGWTGANGDTPEMNVRVIKGSFGDKVFTANWTADGYTISYNLAGGALPDGESNPTAYTIETSNITLVNPARTGYDFAGWTGTDVGSPTTTLIIVKGSTGNRSYTANWTPVVYTIGYDLRNGEIAVQNPLNYTVETPTFTLYNPTRTGYTFTGWTTPDDNVPQETVTIEQGSTGNRIYMANWGVETYAINYDLADGEIAEGANPTTYTVASADITLVNPTKTGYEFAGWTGSNGPAPQTTVYIASGSTTGNRSYTANWTPIEYNITYYQVYPNSTNPVPLVMTNNTTYTIETPTFTLNNPTSDDYVFDGWTGDNGEEQEPTVTIEQGSTGNKTFIAHWGQGIEYTISYFLNGGSEVKANPTKYTVNSVFQLNDPAKPGYTFTGWTGTDLTGETIGPIIAHMTGDRYYTAHWQANTYFVQFRPNGGSGSIATQQYTYDSNSFLLPQSGFVKTGSTFIGWAFTDTAETPDIPLNQPVRNLTTQPNATVILYAVWDLDLCTLTFDPGECSDGFIPEGYVEPMTDISFGARVELPKPDDARWPEFYEGNSSAYRQKRTFLGWLKSSDNSTVIQPGATYLCQGDETFIAVWSANYYNLDRQVSTVETARRTDKVPATSQDTAYKKGGTYALLLGSGGNYSWDCFDMTQVEAALAAANNPANRDLPETMQYRVDDLRTNLVNKYNSVKLLEVDYDAPSTCNHIGDGFYDEYNDTYYPPCEEGGRHSYNSLLAEMTEIFNADNADILYTNTSVQTLRALILGNNFDIQGIVNEVENAALKKPAQPLLAQFVDRMAAAYHGTLELKEASYDEFESLKTDYLPSLHDDVAIGQNVTYEEAGDYYTEDSVLEMKAFYEEVMEAPTKLRIVQQWLLEDGGDLYLMMRDLIDALVPVDAKYTKLFYDILNIPTGTEGFSYPKPSATDQDDYATWIEWAHENAGNISSQMDTDFLSARFTESSVMALYRVLDAIDWDLNIFEQDDVDGDANIWSFHTLLTAATVGLQLRKYMITFKYNDGTDDQFTTQSNYNYKDAIGRFPATNPQRAGFIFKGWSRDTEGTEVVTVDDLVYGNTSLYAIWSPEYTITYDLSGGALEAGVTNPTHYSDDSPDIVLNNPVRTGYDFAGWAGSDGVLNTYMVIISGSTGNLEFTAYWTPFKYLITYDLKGGSMPDGKVNPQFYTIEDDTITLNNPIKPGYEFSGWTEGEESSPQKTMKIVGGSTGDRSFTANWVAAGYAITYALDGGHFPDGVENPDAYMISTPTFTLNNPERTGYEFAGWTEIEGAEPRMTVTIPTGSTGDRTFTAHWTALIYTYSCDAAGGTFENGDTTVDGFYFVNSAPITLPQPTRFGYDFAGWTGADLTEATVDVTIETGSAGNREYTATWAPTAYAINYDLDGGNAENPATYTIEDEITLNAPVKTGYTFAGWTGTDLTTPTMEVTIAVGSTGVREFTATWTVVEYTLNYDLDGGALAQANPATYTIDTRTFTLNNPTKAGYSFAGWTETADDEPQTKVSIAKGSTGNKSFTANWTVITFTITYDLAGGSVATDNPTTYTVEDDDFTLTNPTRTGYTFAGWTGSGLTEASMAVTIAKGSIGYRRYTATWSTIEYTISYTLGGGTAENPTTYTVESASITLQDAVRTGYTFKGWTGDNGTTPQKGIIIDKGSTGDKAFTANWELNVYTINCNLNGGIVAQDNPVSYTVEDAAITLNNPTRRGYEFAGWTGTDLEEATTEVTIAAGSTGNRNYKANWTKNNYTISYDLDGGAVAEANPTTYTVDDDDITLNNPTRTGYTFAGWTGSNGTTPQQTVTIENNSIGDKNYKANWTAIAYNITYVLKGGDATNPATYTIEDEITLNNPTRTGYTFAGWTEAEGDEPQLMVTIAKGSTDDKSFTAHWTTDGYTINYDLAGGAVEGENPENYTIESAAFTLINPTRTGYTFAGWTGTDLAEATIDVTVAAGSTGNRNYTATWTAVNYPITYDLDDGTVAEANPTTYTIEQTVTLHNPTRTGYTFAGWTGTDLDKATTEVTIAAGSTGERSYTATWTAIEYTIDYELDGGAVAEANPTTYTVETKTFTLNNPTKTGYDFVGWTGTGLTGATKELKIETGSTGTRSYTATWTPTNYTIGYDLDGGAVAEANPTAYTIEEDDITLHNPTRTGYTFAGWTGTDLDEATTEVTIAAGSTGARNYTATWTAVSYNITYNLNGGAGENPATYTIETESFALTAPTRAGYTFAGWTGDNGSTPNTSVFIEKGSTGDKSYEANWTVVVYTIGYTLGGGTAENPTAYTVETETFTLNNPTRTGYDFAGWTGTDLDEATTEVTIETGSTGNRSYTATWTPTSYKIDYDLDGGAAENPKTYTIEDEITLNNPTKTGYTFAGWTGDNGTDPQETVKIELGSTGPKSFTANWTVVDYTIDYELDGGEVAEANPKTYTIEDEDIVLNNPTKAAYDFAGWTGTGLDAATMNVTIAAGSTGARAYTATWTATPYAITYDLGGGTAENPETYTIEDEFTLNNPTRTGFTFAGWTVNEGDEPQLTVKIELGSTGAKHFTANWTTDGYSISYDLDGGQATNPNSYTIETATFRLSEPTRAGYTFTGWTGTGLTEQTTEVIIDKGSTGDRSYTAHWTPITYFVKYHSNTADDDTFTMEYIYDTTYQLAENPFSKTGSSFGGWSATVNGEPLEQIVNLTTENNGSIDLYAIWAEIEYTLTFDTNGATSGSVNEKGVTYGQTVTLPDGATLECFSDEKAESRTFLGWSADGKDYAPGAEFICPADDVTFTAIWSANYYALDKLVATIETYRTDDAVPATSKDPKYQAGGELAAMLESDGKYPWDNFDMTAVEAALASAADSDNRDLPQAMQYRVDDLKNSLQTAINSVALVNVDYDAPVSCNHSSGGFYDAYNDTYYPPCGADGKHSYNSLLSAMTAIFNADDADRMYTADSVQALRDVIFGNNFDVVGIKTQVENAALKKPAQRLLSQYVDQMAQAYHSLLQLKPADYTAIDNLITEYLPSLHDDVEAGQNVSYDNLGAYYTEDSVAELKGYYEGIDRNYTNVEQHLIEAGGEVYEGLKEMIDALVPVDADYTKVFYEILTIPTGTEGFSYPAADAAAGNYALWIEWARENAGAISAQMDTEYLSARFTELSVSALYRVLDAIDWNLGMFDQNAVDGADNITSYKTLLSSAIGGLKLRKYTITYMYNDGTDRQFTTQGNYNYGDIIGSFPATDPQREEYIFKGWSSDPEEAVPVTVDAAVNADMTLYAIWKLASEELVELVVVEGSTTVLDEERGFVYGLDFDLTEEQLTNQYLTVIGNGHLEFDRPVLGTGTKVSVINDNTHEEVASFVIVIFGDVDCDGTFTPNDITQLRYMNAGMVARPEAGSAAELATDVDHDEVFGGPNDYTQLRYAKAGMREVAQIAP